MDFMQTQTCQNLARSFAGESQARQRYTQYAQQARKEGFEYLARLLSRQPETNRRMRRSFWRSFRNTDASRSKISIFPRAIPTRSA